MKRRVFSIFLSLALVLSMMPMGLIAVQAAESYNLWLGDVEVTSENMTDIPGVTGGTASYDPDKHVLTVTDVTGINGVHTITSSESAKIYAVDDLKIIGSCKIDASQTTYGIRTSGNLTLDADLEVKDAESIGVLVDGAKKIIINSGIINISSDTSLYGLIGGNGSTLTINDGDITIKSSGHDEDGNGNGLDVGTFEMKGGKLSVVGHAVGLFAYRFYQTGGSIYAEGQIRPGILVGNTSTPALQIKGDVEAVTKSENWSAIQSYKSNISINSDYYIKKPAGAHTESSGDGQIIVNNDQTLANSVIITKKPTPYSLWIAGTQVTSENAENLSVIDGVSLAEGGYAQYNKETKTLDLKDATINNSNSSKNAKELAGIYSEDPLTISVTGTNTINGGTASGSGEPCGIFSVNTLTFDGDGMLTSKGGTGLNGVRSVGIHSTKAITFDGTGTINAQGQTAGYSSCGVRGGGGITINNGTLNASGANDVGGNSKGIYAYSNGVVTINGGTVTASGGNLISGEGNDGSFGIDSSTIILAGGTVIASAGTSGTKDQSYGIKGSQSVTISGGTVTATGYTSALSKAPALGTGIIAGGSTDINGGGAKTYKASNNADYKWFTAPFTTPSVNVSVTDIADGSKLEGATVQVIKTSETGAETVVKEWTSTSDVHQVTGLETGVEYTLRETVSPGGYVLATDTTFSIDETGNVTSTGTITEEGTLLVENAKTCVSILTTDEAGTPISGATIQILGSGSSIVMEWSSTTEAYLAKGLNTNTTYTLHETVPPGEYNNAGDETFIISETGVINYLGDKDNAGNLLIKHQKTTPVTCKASVYIFDNTEKKSEQGGKVRFENNTHDRRFEIQKPEGTSITLTAVPDSDYTFIAWRGGGTEGDELSKATEYTFTLEDQPGGTGIWAVFEKKTSPGPDPSGGGSGGEEPSYKVEVPDVVEHGSVSVDPKSAQEGDTVTITASPDEGYAVENMKVTDKDGKEINVKDNGDGTYSFVMPASKVSIEPVFAVDKEAHDKVCPSKAFDDLDTSLWYHEGTDFVISKGMMNGVGKKTFEPNGTTTRAMIVTILYRLENSPHQSPAVTASPQGEASEGIKLSDSGSFTDIEPGSWYEDAVNWAAANEIVKGISSTSFAPNAKITREQMATILYRYAEFKGADVSGRADLSRFTDASSVSDWAKDAFGWAVDAGLMKGVTETTLDPKGNATRAQVAVLMQRLCEEVLK